jgi:hypothetical protein
VARLISALKQSGPVKDARFADLNSVQPADFDLIFSRGKKNVQPKARCASP